MAPKSSENAFASTAEEARPCWEGAKAAAEPAAAAIRVSVNFIVDFIKVLKLIKYDSQMVCKRGAQTRGNLCIFVFLAVDGSHFSILER
jgi:hypothetical protein